MGACKRYKVVYVLKAKHWTSYMSDNFSETGALHTVTKHTERLHSNYLMIIIIRTFIDHLAMSVKCYVGRPLI